MDFKIYNNRVFEFEYNSKTSFGILIDYTSTKDVILDNVIVDVVTNFSKNLEEKDYKLEREVFTVPFPPGIREFVNVYRKLVENKIGLQ